MGPRLAEMDPEEAALLFDPAKSYKWLIARVSRRLKALDKVRVVARFLIHLAVTSFRARPLMSDTSLSCRVGE